MGVHRFYCGCACGGRDIFRLCNVRHEGVRRAQTAAACTAVVAFPGRVDNFVRFDGDIGGKEYILSASRIAAEEQFGAEAIRISAGRRRVRSAFTSFSSF